MPRYILIDQHSGYVFGDTADMPRTVADADLTPLLAARLLDESTGSPGREYIEHGPHSAATREGTGGYFVYRADINGSEAVPVVHDGQNTETTAAVERDCQLVAFIETRDQRAD